MRRKHSLIGPLLLILLGTLLLARNFRPDFPFWELVGQYWPVVLLVWGLAKLVGAFRAPAPGAPAWRPSLTVGEFFLALLIVLVGISASKWTDVRHRVHFGDMDWDWPWWQTFYFTQVIKQEVEPKSPLRVENPNGDVRVSGSDTKQITVTVNKRIREDSENDAKSLDGRIGAEIVREGSAYLVRVGYHGQVHTDLDIAVPRATPLTLEVRRGTAQAGDVEGDLSAEVDRGDVALTGITGDVRLKIRRGSLSAQNIKGNVELEGRGSDIQVADVTGHLVIRGEYSGASDYSRIAQGVKFSSSRTEMEIQKLPGKVDMTIGSLAITEPGGLVSVNTRNKDIRIEDFPEKVQVVTRGASVVLRTSKLPLRDIEVENHSGTIELAVPAKSEFQIEATARRGEVDSEFSSLEVQRESDTGWIKGKVGGAGASIKLSTSYGTIYLRKLGPDAERPQPAEPRKRNVERRSRQAVPAEQWVPDWPRLPHPPRAPRLPRPPRPPRAWHSNAVL